MIKKIGTIKHFAVFENYNWDLSSTDKNGQPLKFEKINILYGRNYSGKTTLSRIFRSLETGQLPENYDNPQYELIDENGMKTDQNNISDFSYPVRVFNEDFIKRNLKFLIDPNGEIAPFAILGNNNGTLAEEIKELTNEIGNSVEPKTGLNKAVDDATSSYDSANQAWSKAVSDLESKLSKKATDKKIGIKYKPDKFGDVNYNIAKIRSDVQTICQSEYQSPSAAVIANCEAILQDTVHEPITTIHFQHQYSAYKDEAISLLGREVGTSNKIQRLIHDAALNLWVKRGLEIADNASVCPFCGNPITDDFWSEIHAHFDEESKKLDDDISNLTERIRIEINKGAIDDSSIKLQLYSEYVERYEDAKAVFDKRLSEYYQALQELIDQLNARSTNISVPIVFSSDKNCDNDIKEALDKLNLILNENNSFAGELKNRQKKAQSVLRLKEVEDFCNTIDKNGKQAADSKAYFLIERIGNHSSIQALPQYLKSNATEYNYLFSQIYKVSQCVAVTDNNYDILYSFGNSARKFLEMYLYFKYPTDEELLPKLKRFFEPEDVPPILINRLVNEDSHGPTPENSLRAGIDPETIPVAKKILQLLQKDSEQYDAFMESIS